MSVEVAAPLEASPGGAPPAGGSEPSLRQRAVSGVVLVMAQNIVARASLFLGQLVIARILAPADFGAVALASMIANIASSLVFFGADQILQQRRHNARLWSTQVFVLTLAFGVAGAALMLVLGVAGASLFHDHDLPALMGILGLTTILNALWTVPQAALQWRLRFKFLAAYVAFDTVLAQVLIVAAALLGFGPYSFFAPLVLTNLLRLVVYWRVAGARLRPLRASRGWRLMARRGVSALGTRVAVLIVTQGDFFTLAFFAAKPVVGVYFFAFRLASQPMTLLSSSVSSVLFSSLLKVSDRSRRARIAFETAEALGAATVCLSLTLAVAAEPLMSILFGERWRAATPLVQLLSLGMPFDVISWPAFSLLLANGEFRRTFVYQSLSVPVFAVLVLLGAAKAQALGVAAGVAGYYIVHSLVYSTATYRTTSVGLFGAARLFARLSVCALVSFGPTYALLSLPALHGSRLLQLAVAASVGPTLYAAALFLLARGVFENLLRQAANILGRVAPRFLQVEA